MFTYKPRHAFSNWTPPPFNTLESGYVFTIPNTAGKQHAIGHAGDRRHALFIGPSNGNSTGPINAFVYDTHNYSNISSRIPVTVNSKAIRASANTGFCNYNTYRNYYVAITNTTVDSTDMEMEAGYYDFTSGTFKSTTLTKAQFWTPAFPAHNPPPIAGSFQRGFPYFIECGGKIFLFIYFVYSVNASNHTYSQYRVFEIGAEGVVTFVQDLTSSLGNYPNTLVNISGANRHIGLYTPTAKGNTVVINSFLSPPLSGGSNQSGYIQTFLYNGSTFVPQYGEYTRMQSTGYLYALERDGTVITLNYGSIDQGSALLVYSHGASALTELASYASTDPSLALDADTNFMFAVEAGECKVKLFNSSNVFVDVGSITPAQIDAFDPGMFGTSLARTSAIWIHDNAIILRGSVTLGGRPCHALVLGSIS